MELTMKEGEAVEHPELKDLEDTILVKHQEAKARIELMKRKFYDAEMKLHETQMRVREIEDQMLRLAQAFEILSGKDIIEYAARHK